jgi:hypothetical protein
MGSTSSSTSPASTSICAWFAQLTYRESLRDIEACLHSQVAKLYHMGFRSTAARNTLANANTVRDWRNYADFAPNPSGLPRQVRTQQAATACATVQTLNNKSAILSLSSGALQGILE